MGLWGSRTSHLTYCPSDVASRNLASRRRLRSTRPVRRSSMNNRSICSKVNLSPGMSRYSDRIRSICSSSGSHGFDFLVMSDPSSVRVIALDNRNNGTVEKIAQCARLPSRIVKGRFSLRWSFHSASAGGGAGAGVSTDLAPLSKLKRSPQCEITPRF